MDPHLSLIRPCEWEEVFIEIYKNEGENPQWLALARERGFKSWAEWRLKGYLGRFDCRNTTWGLYKVSNPSEVVRDWYGGPFRTWVERYYNGHRTMQFADLARHPRLMQVEKIRSIIEHYPVSTVISAIQLANGEIQVIEGMHRATALTIMGDEGKSFPGTLTFAIGKSDLSELPMVGKNTLDKE